MNWRKEFGASLQKRREDANLSLRALGRRVGVSPETIRQYELGRIPDADKLAKIAVALKTSEFVLKDAKISIVRAVPEPTAAEQLTLDFKAEYTQSTATIQIRPGSIAVTLGGVRLVKAS